MDRNGIVDELDAKLKLVVATIDECADLLRRAGLNSQRNIHRLGNALSELMDVQDEIWTVRPDLTSPAAKPEWAWTEDPEDK